MKTVLLGFLLVSTLSLSIAAASQSTLSVFAVNYPLAYFVERIGGEHVDLYYPIPRDIDPAFWNPSADEVVRIQQVDLVLLNGAGYAKWLNKVSLPYSRLVNTSKSFKQNYISIEETAVHQHGPSGEHSHAGVAFTTWLDFLQADAQARTVMQALIKRRPSAKQLFEHNYQALSEELQTLDRELQQIVSANLAMLASHPVYQYLARRYNIHLESVMWEPDVYPSEADWSLFQALLESHPAKWMIWEDEPDPKIQERLNGMNVHTLVFSPTMNYPETGDFISVMQLNVESIVDALD